MISPERQEWADQTGRKVTIALEHGNIEQALAAIEYAAVTNPDIKEDVRALSEAERLSLPLASCGMSVRTTNMLEDNDIRKVEDLVHRAPNRLLEIEDCGPRCVLEVSRMFQRLGLRWLAAEKYVAEQQQAAEFESTTSRP